MAEQDPSVERGRRLVRAVAVSLIGSVVLLAVLTRTFGAQLVFHVGLLGLLAHHTMRGRAWARWVLAALAGLGGVAYVHGAVTGQEPLWLFVTLGVVYLGSTAVLAFSPPVWRFLEAQQKRS